MLAATLAVAGCPGAQPAATPVDVCTTVGERCRLSANKTGICAQGKTGGLLCADQH